MFCFASYFFAWWACIGDNNISGTLPLVASPFEWIRLCKLKQKLAATAKRRGAEIIVIKEGKAREANFTAYLCLYLFCLLSLAFAFLDDIPLFLHFAFVAYYYYVLLTAGWSCRHCRRGCSQQRNQWNDSAGYWRPRHATNP